MDDEEGPQKDPKNFAFLSFRGGRHDIVVAFRDIQGRRLFDIDSRQRSDPAQYRHRISIRFSRLDSTISIREYFVSMHDGREFHGKIAESDNEMRVVGTLMLPDASFVVKRGAQERRPWPDRTDDFVIDLVVLQTSGGTLRDLLTFKHIGQTTRLEAACGELGLRKHLKSLEGVKEVSICVEDYRGNRDFNQDDVREVLLPRFDTGPQQRRGFQKELAIKHRVLPFDVALASVDQRTLQVSRSDPAQPRKRKAEEIGGVEVNTEVVDSSNTHEEESDEDKADEEESGMIPAEQQSGGSKRARRRW